MIKENLIHQNNERIKNFNKTKFVNNSFIEEESKYDMEMNNINDISFSEQNVIINNIDNFWEANSESDEDEDEDV